MRAPDTLPKTASAQEGRLETSEPRASTVDYYRTDDDFWNTKYTSVNSFAFPLLLSHLLLHIYLGDRHNNLKLTFDQLSV